MDIFEIAQNYDEFQFVLHKTDTDYIDVLDNEGEVIKNWKTPTWTIFSKTQREKKLRRDFNASCYLSGILIIEEYIANKIISDFGVQAQLLPVSTPEFEKKFVFMNLLGTIPAIDNTQNYPETNNFIFKEAIIGNKQIFRDSNYPSQYFCTSKFVDWIREHSVNGLRFDKVGETE